MFSFESDGKYVAFVGIGDFKSYYWQFVPTQTAKYFIIKNYKSKLALSSKGHSHCARFSSFIYELDRCKEWEEYNLLSEAPNNPSTKWIIKSHLIGNGVYPRLFPFECGRPSFIGAGVSIGGTPTEKGEWPFLAALFHQPSNEFFCAGTIITKRNILTGVWSLLLLAILITSSTFILQ